MSALFQKIAEQLNDELPFVFYCKPNSDKIIALLQKNDALFELEQQTSGFAFVSFDNQQRYLIPEKASDVYVETVSNFNFIVSKQADFSLDENAKNHFEDLVKKAVFEIENGSFEKVVLSRTELVAVVNFDLESIFNQLILNYATAFNYCFYHPKVGFWMGASPEQFLKIEEKVIKTVALAGTQLNTGSEDVKWDKKEVNEQQIVVDFIVENLKKYSHSVSKSEPYTFQAGSIVHIKTDIEAVIEETSDLNKIINSLHPTPAVCGFPKELAKAFILKNEGYDRTFYAGFLGEWNKDFLTYKEGSFDLFVNLRCMKIKRVSKSIEAQAQLFIGCGINKGSNPENEFVETVNKSQIMKKVL